MKSCKIKIFLFLFLCNFFFAQTLFMTDKHLVGVSSILLLDTEGVIDPQTQDYSKEYFYKAGISFLYSYNSILNLQFSLFSSEVGGYFFNDRSYSVSLKYFYKNILTKIIKNMENVDSGLYKDYDFNINFLIDYEGVNELNPSIASDQSSYPQIGYGIGFSKEFKGTNYNSFPELFFANYKYNNEISEKRLILEVPVEIKIQPRDNIASPNGFWIAPSVTLYNLKDAVIGISSGFYHNF